MKICSIDLQLIQRPIKVLSVYSSSLTLIFLSFRSGFSVICLRAGITSYSGFSKFNTLCLPKYFLNSFHNSCLQVFLSLRLLKLAALHAARNANSNSLEIWLLPFRWRYGYYPFVGDMVINLHWRYGYYPSLEIWLLPFE